MLISEARITNLLKLIYRMKSGKHHQYSATKVEMDGNHLYAVIHSRKDDSLEQPRVEATCMHLVSPCMSLFSVVYIWQA